MCNPDNTQIMEEVVSDFINVGKSFTAFDATQEGMRRGTTERHSHLKGQVHANIRSFIRNGSYERSLIPTPNGNAWLYHPTGVDVQSYIDNNIVTVNNNRPADPVTPLTDNTVKKQVVDSEGRLPIYGDMLKEIDCKPGMTVEVVVSSNKISIAQFHPGPASSDDHYKVNADGRIRISAKVMNEFGPATFVNLTLDKDLKQITVTL